MELMVEEVNGFYPLTELLTELLIRLCDHAEDVLKKSVLKDFEHLYRIII